MAKVANGQVHRGQLLVEPADIRLAVVESFTLGGTVRSEAGPDFCGDIAGNLKLSDGNRHNGFVNAELLISGVIPTIRDLEDRVKHRRVYEKWAFDKLVAIRRAALFDEDVVGVLLLA